MKKINFGISALLIVGSTLANAAPIYRAPAIKHGESSNFLLIAARSDKPKDPPATIRVVTGSQGDMTALILDVPNQPSRRIDVRQLIQGTVLMNDPKDAVRVRGDLGFTGKDGGRIELDYLHTYNVVGKNVRANTSIEVVREGGRWVALEGNRQPFNKMILHTETFGIKKITTALDPTILQEELKKLNAPSNLDKANQSNRLEKAVSPESAPTLGEKPAVEVKAGSAR